MHEAGRGPWVTCMACTESQGKRCLSTCALDILTFRLLLHAMTLMALITHLSITCFDTRTPLGGGEVLEYIRNTEEMGTRPRVTHGVSHQRRKHSFARLKLHYGGVHFL